MFAISEYEKRFRFASKQRWQSSCGGRTLPINFSPRLYGAIEFQRSRSACIRRCPRVQRDRRVARRIYERMQQRQQRNRDNSRAVRNDTQRCDTRRSVHVEFRKMCTATGAAGAVKVLRSEFVQAERLMI